MMGIQGLYKTKKSWSGDALKIYGAPKLCTGMQKITSFQPSEGQFSEKSGIFSKVKILKNAFNKK